MIRRGLMVMSVLQQMPRELDRDELDIMIADLPPGTGSREPRRGFRTRPNAH